MEEIKFYLKNEPYFEFSNYYMSPFIKKNIQYMSIEHYFQSQKFNQPNNKLAMEYFNLIIQADTPQKMKDMGNQKTNYRGCKWFINKNNKNLGLMNDIIKQYKSLITIRDDWNDIRDKIMYKGLKKKFKDPELKKILLNTGDAYLIENSPRDYYWGIGKDGNGENKLGKLLMKLRHKHQMDPHAH